MNAYFVSVDTGEWWVVKADSEQAACAKEGKLRADCFVRSLTADDVAALRGKDTGLCPPAWMRKAHRRRQGVLL